MRQLVVVPHLNISGMKYLLLFLMDPTHFWQSRCSQGTVEADKHHIEEIFYKSSPLKGFRDATPRSFEAPHWLQINQSQPGQRENNQSQPGRRESNQSQSEVNQDQVGSQAGVVDQVYQRR